MVQLQIVDVGHNVGLANGVATENQLLSEEKWIIEALKTIRKQRHALQVEKLHLISKRVQIRMAQTYEAAPASKESNPITRPEVVPTDNDMNMDIPDGQGNEEELNLSVSNHFIQRDGDMDMEEYEDEDAEDDDYDIDVNMFMNGEHAKD